jgi:hypothetical protein
MPERRPYKRYQVDLLGVTCSAIQTNEVDMVNISLKGISLRVKKRLNMGETYTLKIKSKNLVINLKCIVIWSKISGNRKDVHGNAVPLYSAGLEFTDVSDDNRKQISNFIGAHKKDENNLDMETMDGMRFSPRVQVVDPEEAFIIDQTENHTVKKLSYSGALIESRYPMKVSKTVPMMLNLSQDKFFVFRGKVASCFLIRNAYPKAYDIGIEFTYISENERLLLSDFIRLLDTIDKSPAE